jgi:hypothetical protein
MSIATTACTGIRISRLVALYGKVEPPSSSESQLLLYCAMIVGFLAMSVMMKIRGSTTTPLIKSI